MTKDTCPASRSTTAPDRWRHFLDDHRSVAAAGVFGLAMLVRVVYAMEVRGSPVPELWRGSQTDMHFFVTWARALAAGDWLTDQALHPYFTWQQPVGTPAEWTVWYGGKTFHQAPLYPYLLGLVFAVVGSNLWVVYGLQAVCSGLTAVLLMSITRRLFGSVAGLLGGLMTALYGTLLFYDFVALRTSLTVFLSALVVWLLMDGQARGGWRRWFAAGIGMGLATLLRPNAVLMLVLVLAGILLLMWRQWRAMAVGVSAVVVGFAACLVPLVVRNLRVGAPPLGLEAVGATTFYLSNAAGAPGSGYGMLPGFPDVVRRTQGRFVELAREALRTHESPGSLVRLIGRKLSGVFHYFERNNNANSYYAERFSRLLRWGTLPYWIVLPLGLVGLYLTWPLRRRLIWLYAAMLAPMATIVLFYQTDRFRLPMIVGLIPLASAALEWMLARRGNVAAGSVIAILLCVLVRWPNDADPPAIQRRDFAAGVDVLIRVGRYEAAITEAREATRRFPNDPLVWVALVRSLEVAGQIDAARRALDEAVRFVPRGDARCDELDHLRQKLGGR